MQYRLNIVDNKNVPLGGGKVEARHGYTGPAFRSFPVPGTGFIVFDTDFDGDIFQSGVVLVSVYKGYYDTAAPANSLAETTDFILEKKPNILLPVVIGAGALLLISRKGKKVKGFLDNMPPMAKNAIVLGGVGIAAWYLIFRNKDDNDDLPKNAANELAQLAAQGIYPTFSEAQASGMASTIVSAADDCGTDESAMWQVMQHIENKADILLLAKVYGIREYKGCFDGDYLSWHRRNLAETLTSELSGGWIQDINDLFASKGINFKF